MSMQPLYLPVSPLFQFFSNIFFLSNNLHSVSNTDQNRVEFDLRNSGWEKTSIHSRNVSWGVSILLLGLLTMTQDSSIAHQSVSVTAWHIPLLCIHFHETILEQNRVQYLATGLERDLLSSLAEASGTFSTRFDLCFQQKLVFEFKNTLSYNIFVTVCMLAMDLSYGSRSSWHYSWSFFLLFYLFNAKHYISMWRIRSSYRDNSVHTWVPTV